MQKNKKIGVVVIAVLVVGTAVLITVASADARVGQNKGVAKGIMKQVQNDIGNQFTEEQKTQLQTVFVNADYEAWKAIVGEDAKVYEKIDSSNFAKFAQMHVYKQKAGEIAEELGLGQMYKKGQGQGKMGQQGHFKGKQGQNLEARQAIEAKDYEAWKTAVSANVKMLEAIDTSAKFDKLVLMHQYSQAGDYDKAMEIRQELQIPVGRGWMKK